MPKRLVKSLGLCVAFLIVTTARVASAQGGVVMGTVEAKAGNQPIAGAVVTIEGFLVPNLLASYAYVPAGQSCRSECDQPARADPAVWGGPRRSDSR
jgi:hypothetical protein